MGLKVPRGMGILTNPRKAVYNKIYNKTSKDLTSITFRNSRSFSEKEGVPESIWNTGNFKSREAMLAKAKESNITTANRVRCPRCTNDLWAIVPMSFLFLKGYQVFCEICGKPAFTLKEFNNLRN